MVSLAQQIAELKKQYPACWEILKKQYQLKDFSDSNFVTDDIENVKIKLYAEIISRNRINEKKRLEEVKNKLTKK